MLLGLVWFVHEQVRSAKIKGETMLYPKIEECIEKIGCKYTLTIVASKRAKDLTKNAYATFADSKTKELTYALTEVATGKLGINRILVGNPEGN